MKTAFAFLAVAAASYLPARAEAPYSFRERLLCVHAEGVRDAAAVPAADEFVFEDGCVVGDADFADYLSRSLGVVAASGPGAREAVRAVIDTSLREREYEVEVAKDGVRIRAGDDRAMHQAYYHLEDLMNLRRAPFLRFGRERRRAKFSPRMVHSGYSLDIFPDEHLSQMAHYGIDAILVFLKGVDRTQGGGERAGVNDIIARARAFGIDTYLYSKVAGFAHPDDPDGAAKLEESFGGVAAAHPGAKGIVFVGESCQFPSRDPRVQPVRHRDKDLNDPRPLAGWFPCRDYPDWLSAVRRAIRAHAPQMEIVFWTYNWSRQPIEPIVELIPKFPDGVAVQSTFGKGEETVHRNGLRHFCRDYTLSFAGPTRHFAAEAAAAKSGGRRLYAMVNTGGLTWDYGVVPFQPCPYQWKRRCDALGVAQSSWGLSGLMESHHYGWYPSFVSELVKEAYVEGGIPFDEHIRRIAVRDFGEGNAGRVLSVWRRWSDAALDYVATNENQYGPFRIGPAYPFNFGGRPIEYGEFPQSGNATFKMRWMAYLNYPYDKAAADLLNIVYTPLPGGEEGRAREMELLESMRDAWMSGAAELREISESLDGARREAARRLAGIGEWHGRTVLTAINLRRGHAAWKRGDSAALLECARSEYGNAKAALALAEADSRLGWEPSMEYAGGPDQIRWKLERMRSLFEGLDR